MRGKIYKKEIAVGNIQYDLSCIWYIVYYVIEKIKVCLHHFIKNGIPYLLNFYHTRRHLYEHKRNHFNPRC